MEAGVFTHTPRIAHGLSQQNLGIPVFSLLLSHGQPGDVPHSSPCAVQPSPAPAWNVTGAPTHQASQPPAASPLPKH